jgi:glucose-specific phosphotransferase system IIA component
MGFFDKLKHARATTTPSTIEIGAPAAGGIIAMQDIADPVFAGGMLGTCVGIDPDDGLVVSPVDGTVGMVADTGHAVGIVGANGVEILIHLGIDTVSMGGKGFDVHASSGQKVKKGDSLIDMDLAAVEAAGYADTVITIVSSQGGFETLSAATPDTVQPGDALFTLA